MSMGIGFVAIIISAIAFGTSFVPTKKVKTGDGVFFQWLQCSAIFMVGFIVQLARGSPRFEPLAIIGGMLWCTGNLVCPLIVRFVGLGLGMLIWGGSSLITGWASGRFGILGVSQQPVGNYPVMNAIGVVICICALGIMFFVKDKPKAQDAMTKEDTAPRHDSITPNDATTQETGERNVSSHSKTASETPSTTIDVVVDVHKCDAIEMTSIDTPMNQKSVMTVNVVEQESTQTSMIDKLGPNSRRLLGSGLAVCAGLLFGLNFNPSTHLMDEANADPNSVHSTNAWDYVFSHFMGVYFTSTCYFIIYSGIMKDKPVISSEMCLRGFLSGFIWSIGQLGYFVANQELSFVITFPINSTVPGMIASLIGIIVYKEITDRRAIMILLSAIVVAIVGVILIALSKIL